MVRPYLLMGMPDRSRSTRSSERSLLRTFS
jgi:hypothetical protein